MDENIENDWLHLAAKLNFGSLRVKRETTDPQQEKSQNCSVYCLHRNTR
jgi:hypothetical protein